MGPGLLIAYLILFGSLIFASFVVATVWFLIGWVRDSIHLRSLHHTIETRRRHRG